MIETVARYLSPVTRRPVTRLLLVRHGQSEWNADGRWQGQADPPLSALGEEQAIAAVDQLDEIDVVYASDLVRAARTAEILAEQLGVDLVVDARLRERHAGEWQGFTRDEIEAEWPGYLAAGDRPPGWESDDRVVVRALEALAAIARAHPDGVVLLVTHGGIVRTLERHLGDRDDQLLPNLGGRWLELDGNGFRLGDRVLLLDGVAVTRPQQI